MSDIDQNKIIENYSKRAAYHNDFNAVLYNSLNQNDRFNGIILDYLTRRALIDALKPVKSDFILDFGCGVGRITFPLSKKVKEIHGVDISPDLLRIAELQKVRFKNKNVEFHLLDTVNPVFPEVMFDKIFTASVILHLGSEQIKSNLKLFNNHLKNDGKLILLEYAKEKTIKNNSESILRSIDDLKIDFSNNGFEFLKVKPVIRMPSYSIGIWKRINKDWKFLLPLLYLLERMTLKRKPEFVTYYWYIIELKKRG